MSEPLFDCTAEYESMLNRGIRLSGENQEFFIQGRITDLCARLPRPPRRILDFGCGVGKACAYLAQYFPGSTVVGADLSDAALSRARHDYAGHGRIFFTSLAELPPADPFDLCYVNGVFHHIAPAERQGALELIRRCLRPGAHLALFENNPWNPGTRLVMSRIPFDRTAIPLSFLELRRRMRQAGYEIVTSRFLFYLPRTFRFLRPLERWLVNVPLGAQYYVLARVPRP